MKRLSFSKINPTTASENQKTTENKPDVGSLEPLPSARSDSSYDDSSVKARSIDSDDDISSKLNEGLENPTSQSKFRKGINKFFKKQAKAFVRNFIDYGPPYSNSPFDVALINECAKPVFNFFEVHKILNTRVNPNQPDPEDLYYTPIHWCARNAHFMGLKMLKRAGANFHLTNELGLTPLDLCVMMKHPPTKRKDQVNMALYLLENGSPVNSRDKGGYSAIDHAAVNQDLELINMLLDFGANVVRDNCILVAKRHHILRNVYDPECYKVLYERLLYEMSVVEKERARKAKEDALAEQDKHYEKLHVSLDKRKLKRIARDKAKADAMLKATLADDRTQKIRDEMDRNLRDKLQTKHRTGIWERDCDGSDHWVFKDKSQAARATTDSKELYASNLKIMESLRVRNEIDTFNTRWKSATGGSSLELPWKKAEPFILPSIGGPANGKQNQLFLDNQQVDSAQQQGESLEDLLADMQSL